jgi:5-formyltetrahydrofolate cyclo-ligase
VTPSVQERKGALRRQLREVLSALDPRERAAASAAACARLAGQPAWRGARSVLAYCPLPGELDIESAARAALAEGKQLAVLRYEPGRGAYAAYRIADWERDLVPGAFGIREPAAGCPPADMMRLDFVLVPGLGFSADGRRLGRGKGYYDRVLAQVRGLTCGVAFDQQVVDEIPTEPHDVHLDCILTPTRWCCAGRGAAMK